MLYQLDPFSRVHQPWPSMMRPCCPSHSSTSLCPSSSTPWPAIIVRAFVHVAPTPAPRTRTLLSSLGPAKTKMKRQTQTHLAQLRPSQTALLPQDLKYVHCRLSNASVSNPKICLAHWCFILFVFYSLKISVLWPSIKASSPTTERPPKIFFLIYQWLCDEFVLRDLRLQNLYFTHSSLTSPPKHVALIRAQGALQKA